MIVHFEGKEYNFEIDGMDVAQARAIKRQTGLTIRALYDGLKEIDVDCLVALYWLMKNQSGEMVDMNKVNFKLGEFSDALSAAIEKDRADELGLDVEEYRKLVAEAEKRDIPLEEVIAGREVNPTPPSGESLPAPEEN